MSTKFGSYLASGGIKPTWEKVVEVTPASHQQGDPTGPRAQERDAEAGSGGKIRPRHHESSGPTILVSGSVVTGAGAGGGAGACIGAPRVAGHNAVELTLRLCTAKGTAGRKFEQQPRPLPQLRRVAYETLVAERKYNAVFVR